jgi:hypothetical protein
LALSDATASPSAPRATIGCCNTSASTAHRTADRVSFAFGSAAAVVSCRHTRRQLAHRYGRIVTASVVGAPPERLIRQLPHHRVRTVPSTTAAITVPQATPNSAAGHIREQVGESGPRGDVGLCFASGASDVGAHDMRNDVSPCPGRAKSPVSSNILSRQAQCIGVGDFPTAPVGAWAYSTGGA